MTGPRLAYIGGLSRSGSTLLELLLATAPGVTTVGELQILPHELAGNNRTDLLCGCGTAVPECPLWGSVATLHQPQLMPEPQLHHFREHYNWGHTLRPARFGDGRGALRHHTAEQARIYLANTNAVLHAIADATEGMEGTRPEVIVDASKDPYRAIWLARAGGSDVKVIHLVRDPRGSVCSLTRGQPSRRARLAIAARRSAAWVVENELLRRLGTTLGPDRYRLVRYEDLAADPNAVIAELAAFVGFEPPADAATAYRTLSVHTVAGNPMRSDRRPIQPDHRWSEELSRTERSVIDAITVVGRRRWGYGQDPVPAKRPADASRG